jgi:hypothetical protein
VGVFLAIPLLSILSLLVTKDILVLGHTLSMTFIEVQGEYQVFVGETELATPILF